MFTIYDDQGNSIAAIPLSEKQIKLLDVSSEITVLWHTPRMLQSTLGTESGHFTLYKDGNRIIAPDSAALRKYASLQSAIMAAREQS